MRGQISAHDKLFGEAVTIIEGDVYCQVASRIIIPAKRLAD
jgi:hypothetical protein